MKQLIVNADDFGFTRDVNAGIVHAHREGILTATTLMANGNAFDDAVRLAADHPDLDVGIHFVLIGGDSLLTGKPFPRSVSDLLTAVYAGQLNLYEELAAQARKIIGAGVRPLHADTHKHTHLLAPVRRALCAVAEEFGIRFIRRPADSALPYRAPLSRRLISILMRQTIPGLLRDLNNYSLRATDHFAGFVITGDYNAKDLVALLPRLPDGVTELMTHPGRCTEELLAAPTRLKQCRVQELKALTDPLTRQVLSTHNISLTRYRELCAPSCPSPSH